MNQQEINKLIQESMNKKGESLKVDGDFGPKTQAAASKYDFHIEAIKDDMTPIVAPPEVSIPVKLTFTEPIFKIVSGVKFKDRGNYNTKSGKFSGLVVHYTVSGNSPSSAKGVIGWLADQGYGCMVMDLDGVIYVPENFDVFKSWGYHAGVSKWGDRSSVSDVFAGLEICNWGRNSKVGPFRTVTTDQGYVVAGTYQQYTEAQEKSLINFCLWAKSLNPEFSFDNVIGHDEARREAGKLGDKQDPSGSLSMTMPQLRNLLKQHDKYKGELSLCL